MSQDKLVLEAIEKGFEGLGVIKGGVSKAEDEFILTSNMAAGDFMNRKQVDELMDMVVDLSGWLGDIRVKRVEGRQGEMPQMLLSDLTTEFVTENDSTEVKTRPETRTVPYNCKKTKTEWFITTEDIIESRVSGTRDFEAKVRTAFAKAMGNDLARIALNSDTALWTDGTTRTQRALGILEGWRKQAGSGKGTMPAGNIVSAGGGIFTPELFPYMMSVMPDEYKNHPELRWYYNSVVDLGWNKSLTGLAHGVPSGATSDVGGSNALGVKAASSRGTTNPFGIIPVIVPQMPINLGASSDETEIYLTPKDNFILVMQYKMRAYQKFEQEYDRYRITIYSALDVCIENPEALVQLITLEVPQFRPWA